MIDEKRLIKNICDICEKIENNVTDFTENYTYQTLKEVLELIDEQPKVGEWIPVSERLPIDELKANMKRGIYLYPVLATIKEVDNGECFYITTKAYFSYSYSFDKYTFIDSDNSKLNVIAWQPLPKPYEEEI